MKTPQESDWVHAREFCRRIGISSSTLRRYTDAGIMPFRLRRTPNGFRKMYSLRKGCEVFHSPTRHPAP